MLEIAKHTVDVVKDGNASTLIAVIALVALGVVCYALVVLHTAIKGKK